MRETEATFNESRQLLYTRAQTTIYIPLAVKSVSHCEHATMHTKDEQGVFTLGRFGEIKTNAGVISLIVWFILISVNVAI